MTSSKEQENNKEITTFSTIDWMTSCLTDSERTSKIILAIQKAVRPGDIVLDVGTGSGILAMAAARAGAKKVIAAEIDSFVATLARKNIAQNQLQDIVRVVDVDAEAGPFDGGEVFDVVIMEMLTTGMIDEHQVGAVNNLYRHKMVDERTRFIPARQDTFIALSSKDFQMYGFDMRMTRHLWPWLPDYKPELHSKREVLSSIAFNTVNQLDFKKTHSFVVEKAGTVNSISLSSETVFADEEKIGATLALNAPIVVPLAEDIVVAEGDVVELEISYVFGGGFQSLVVKKI